MLGFKNKTEVHATVTVLSLTRTLAAGLRRWFVLGGYRGFGQLL